MEEDAILIQSLAKRRRQMAIQAEELQARVNAMKADIRALDQSLRVLGYEGELTIPKKAPQTVGLFGQNEMCRLCGQCLREAKEPMQTRDVAAYVLEQKGWDLSDKRFLAAMTEKVARALERKRIRGTVNVEKRGGRNYWKRAM